MRKQTQNITLILMWLIVMIFVTHSVIPHHHHLDSVFGHHKTGKETTGQQEDNPFHCHAFNELVADVTIISSGNTLVPDNFSAFYATSLPVYNKAENHCGNVQNGYLIPKPAEELLSKSSPTRGSPDIF